MCPYHVLCPDGEGGPPFDDRLFDDEDAPDGILPPNGDDLSASNASLGGSCAPIANKFNAWVSISSISTCRVWHVVNKGGYEPSWGMDGSHKDLTFHMLCCEVGGQLGSYFGRF